MWSNNIHFFIESCCEKKITSLPPPLVYPNWAVQCDKQYNYITTHTARRAKTTTFRKLILENISYLKFQMSIKLFHKLAGRVLTKISFCLIFIFFLDGGYYNGLFTSCIVQIFSEQFHEQMNIKGLVSMWISSI